MTRLRLPGCSKVLVLGSLWLVLAASAPAVAGTVVVGTPADINNCMPFGCDYSHQGNGQYQQVYSNSLFSGPITITGLEFYDTIVNSPATGMNTGTFTISLSTTPADWNTLSATPANNIGGDNTQVFSGSLAQPWAFGDTLSITLSNSFTYTPGAGANLLMNIVATGTSATSGYVFFDARNDARFGRYSSEFGSSGVDNGYGLVTGFDTGSIATPEPATLVLLSVGLAGLSLLRKRVRR